ncbi:carbohydrate ABC transporter permease [Agromyces aerolatus]|uniref:carbohydrate ABC transporter permease n=1 Tax=Agromyces sp. LY-1074 TaxID=3074080 RepID=UPI0028582BCA|nr:MULTISPECIES: carbohydrate ABC transporter permease [unclassified Agromyces]MDR5701371.1 carbohydrate ABC transporter permease [Agromyces sp. LY-1074]MDR5706840.1 carbohydrate ABC transporter permease [Agromyces sp. LY-1358]
MSRAAVTPRRILSGLGLTIALAALVVICIFPYYWMFITSVKPEDEIFTRTPQLWTTNPTWDRYADLFQGEFLRQLGNSLIVSLGTVVLTLVFAIGAAYALARLRVRWRTVILIVLLSLQMLPEIVLIIPLFNFAVQAGFINTLIGVIVANLTTSVAFTVWLLRGYLLSIPNELEEAAWVDGASRFGALWRIVLPLAWPGIAAAAIYGFISAWNELLIAVTFLRSDDLRTLPVALQSYFNEYFTDWGGVMAASTLFSLPILIFFGFIQRHLAQGFGGALK